MTQVDCAVKTLACAIVYTTVRAMLKGICMVVGKRLSSYLITVDPVQPYPEERIGDPRLSGRIAKVGMDAARRRSLSCSNSKQMHRTSPVRRKRESRLVTAYIRQLRL
jgi:hypothetical protein